MLGILNQISWKRTNHAASSFNFEIDRQLIMWYNLAKSVGLKFIRSEEMIDQRSGKKFIMNYYEKNV